MEELLLDSIKYILVALGGMIFALVLDVMAKRGDDKSDAANGILRGKEAEDFVALAEENARRANDIGALLPPRAGDTTGTLYRPKSIGEGERRALIAAERFRSLFATDDIEELSPYQAGIAAYSLGKRDEDNPYRDEDYLGSEWEAGYYYAMRKETDNLV